MMAAISPSLNGTSPTTRYYNITSIQKKNRITILQKEAEKNGD